MQEKRIQTNQIELQVRDYENNREGILFLHFSGANLLVWQLAVPYFQDIYRLVLVDLRGHGKSDKPEAGYDMDEMARDVSGVMEQLKLEKAHVIGSSMGAEVGLSLAANEPEKVISLICDGALSSEYGPYGTWAGSKDEFNQHVAGSLDQLHNSPEKIYPSVDALVEKSKESLDEIGWWNEYVEAMERYGAYHLDDGKITRGFRKFAREDYYKHYFQYRLEDYYKKVKCPILLVPGEDVFENKREKAAMEGLRKLAAQAQIQRVSGWEHPYGWLIHPEPMCQAILKFLSRNTP